MGWHTSLLSNGSYICGLRNNTTANLCYVQNASLNNINIDIEAPEQPATSHLPVVLLSAGFRQL